jgi:hypothetical protein
MESQLFAFRVATPIEYIGEEPIEFTYDPQAQTSVWTGSGQALAALHCTTVTSGRSGCNAYGTYCTTFGGSGHKRCDS